MLGSSGASWAEVNPVAEGLPHAQETLGSTLSMGMGRIFINYCLDVMINPQWPLSHTAADDVRLWWRLLFLLRPSSVLRTQRLKLYGFMFLSHALGPGYLKLGLR